MAIEIIEPDEELKRKCKHVYTVVNHYPDYASEEARMEAYNRCASELVERFRRLERLKNEKMQI